MKVKRKRWDAGIEGCLLMTRGRCLSMALSIKITACTSWRYLLFQGKQISPLSTILHSIPRVLCVTKERSWMEWWWRSSFPSSLSNFFLSPSIRTTRMTSNQSNTISTNIDQSASSSPSSCGTSCFLSTTFNLRGISMRRSMTIQSALLYAMPLQ